MHADDKSRQPDAPTPAGSQTSTERRIPSSELFGGAREIVIEHGGRIYRMRITQNGKLILTA